MTLSHPDRRADGRDDQPLSQVLADTGLKPLQWVRSLGGLKRRSRRCPSPRQADFVEVCAVDDLWIGEMDCFDVGSAEVLLLNVGGRVACLRRRLPAPEHAPCRRRFDGEVLTCRAHEWSFDARSGQGINPAGECLRRFPLRVVDGKVFVATNRG